MLVEAALVRAEEAEAADDLRILRAALAALRRAGPRPAGSRRSTATTCWPRCVVIRTAARHSLARAAARGRPRARAIRRLVRALPALAGTRPEAPRATTFAEAEWRLPDIAAMGFDVLYVPPIHPIGRTNRKGRNNTLTATPDDVGSPYAIGSADGGHDAVAPELGGLERFLGFRRAVEAHGMEMAMDIAIQASPDHPYVTAHPGWFRHSPDGSIKYAENPPKKYQDIYPIDFGGEDAGARASCGTSGSGSSRSGSGVASDLPRRQPAHQADPVLGLADRRDPGQAPGRHLPVGGVHEAEDDAAAGEDRLHPELHVLHVARVGRGSCAST